MKKTGSPVSQVEIQLGLPQVHRRRAAEIYYEAFRQKFEPILESPEHGISILEKSLDPEFVIVALVGDWLAGVAGVQYGGRHFVDLRPSILAREFGWLRGIFKFLLFAVAARRQRRGELLMDGIVVDPDMRGQRIGTHLLEAVFDLAHTKGFGSVRLDVVDTNPRARRLYERVGFVATQTHKYPFLRDMMGFSASTTMIKEIELQKDVDQFQSDSEASVPGSPKR